MAYEQYERLTDSYFGFFKALPYVAVSPYFGAFATGCLLSPFTGGGPNGHGGALAGGIVLCSIFTVIPVLPIFTAVTVIIVLAAFIIAGLSALFTYPAIAISNCISNNAESDVTLFSLE